MTTGKMSGRRSARYREVRRRRRMGLCRDGRHETAGGLQRNRNQSSALNDSIELDHVSCNRDQNINGSRRRMRMRPLHMYDAVIVRTLQLWKMRVEERSIAAITVD